MLQQIDPKTLTDNVFSMMADRWFLITAGDRARCNTMTAGWGGLGVLWGEPCATVFIRPQRYTKEFVDSHEKFTLCFFGDGYRKELALCGAKSGRELDKIKECGFTVGYAGEDAPYIEQASLVLVCSKWYVQDMDPAAIPADMRARWYPNEDYHTVYVGRIEQALINK